ncbi:MAG: hypothetical protein ABR598_06995 [Candidatus Dormibacteria bacterium]
MRPWRDPAERHHATPRAAGIAELAILTYTREQYAYWFATQQVLTVRRALPYSDYGPNAIAAWS